MKTRVCCKCKRRKIMSSFYKDKSESSGYKHKCKTCCKKEGKDWYWSDPKEASAKVVFYGNKRKESWTQLIPKVSQCELCGKTIYFNIGKSEDVVHFDHRHGGKEKIKVTPNIWLRNNKFNEKNKEIFESCDFGRLCFQCNRRLPTDGRIEWLKKAIDYATKSETL